MTLATRVKLGLVIAYVLGMVAAYAASPASHPRCYRNAKEQLVCQECREVAGKVQCGRARIVRQPAAPSAKPPPQ